MQGGGHGFSIGVGLMTKTQAMVEQEHGKMCPHRVVIDSKVPLSAVWRWCSRNCDYEFSVDLWETRFESKEEAMAFQLAMM